MPPSDPSQDRRDLLGRCMEQARTRAGLGITAAATKVGLSRGSWERIEKRGGTARPDTYGKIDQALDWPAETSRRILSGEINEPPYWRPVDVATGNPRVLAVASTLQELSDDDQQKIVAMVAAYVQASRPRNHAHGDG